MVFDEFLSMSLHELCCYSDTVVILMAIYYRRPRIYQMVSTPEVDRHRFAAKVAHNLLFRSN